MPRSKKRCGGDTTPVTGGVGIPRQLVADLAADDRAPTDDLGRQAFWLLKLHADKLSLKFRKSDLNAMDDATKRTLIEDIQHCLGVKPLLTDAV